MLMKNSTFIKGLLATSFAFLGVNMPVSAQDAVEEPQDSVVTVKTVYQMVDHVTSGNTYVMAIYGGKSWLAAVPPLDFGTYYPAPGRMLCEVAFQTTDSMQIIPDAEVYLPTMTITKDENGFILQTSDGKYIGVNKPILDDKDKKDDDKDDGKGQSMEYTFLVDTTLIDDYYWDITYDDELGGFTLKNRGTNASVGVDFEELTSVDENNEPYVIINYRVAPYETLPEDLIAPIYLFELQEVIDTGIESATMDQSKEPKMVYSLSGVLMGHTTEGLKPGVYVVKEGKSVQKIMVK